MSVKHKENGKNKALSQEKAGIDGDLLGPFMPSLRELQQLLQKAGE